MAGPFNITAALQLQAPTNLQAVVGDIQRKLSNITATVNIQVNSGSIGTLSQLNQQLQALQTNLAAVQAQASASTNAVNRISSAYQQAGSQANSSAAQVAASNQALQAQTLVVEQTATAMENFGRQAGLAARRYSAFLLAGGAIVGFANEIRNAVGSALSFERELIKLVQSGDDASTTVKSLEVDITRLATSWGVSSKALLDTTVQLRLAGLTMQETKIAMEALAKASLAPDFGSMTETAEGFLAIMNQFKVSAKEAADALGSVNAVSVQYAVTSRDIIDAVVRAGGAFRTIGGNLNELIAIFTSIRSTTRESAESIGTALRTILVRMERPQVLENLRQLGVELRRTREEAIHLGDANLEGQFVGPYEAIRRLSQALQGLRTTDIRFAGIAEELGGYRQISKTIPALQEFAKAQQIYQVAQAGTNSLTSAAEQAQAAFLVRLTKVREEFQALIRTVTESKGFQVFLDIVIQLTHGLNQLASVLTPLIPLIAALGVFKLGSGIANFGKGLAGGFVNAQTPRFASGGVVPGTGDSDSVYAQLTPGEYVVRKKAAQKIGYDRLHQLNRYATGGLVKLAEGGDPRFYTEDIIQDREIKQMRKAGMTDEMIKAEEARRLPTAKTIAGSDIARYLSKEIVTGREGLSGAFGEVQMSGHAYGQQVTNRQLAIGEFQKAGPGVIGDTIRIPYTPGDSLGIIGFGPLSQSGPSIINSGVEKTSIGNLNVNVQQALLARGVKNISALVNRHVISAEGTEKFHTKIASRVSDHISRAFKEEFPKSTHDFKLSYGQTASINGYLLEQYITGLSGRIPGGNNVDFDFHNAGSFEGTELADIVYPKVTANLLDAKADVSTSNRYSLLGKYLNMRARQGDPLLTATPKASGGYVDSIPSLLTPGEFVINAGAAQRIGYTNLDRMNRTGVAHFAQGGEVRHYEGGSPGGVAPSVLGGTAQGEFTRQEALAMAQSMNIAGAEIGRMLLQFRQLGIGINSLDKAIISFTEGLEARVLGRRTPIVTDYSRPGFTPQPTVGVQPVTVQPVPVYPAVDPRRDRLANQLEGAPGIPVQARPVYPAVNQKKDFLAEELEVPYSTPTVASLTASRTPVTFRGARQRDISNKLQYNVGQQLEARGGAEYVSRQTQQEVKIAELNKIYDQLIREETDRLKSAGKVKSATEQQRIAMQKVNDTLSRLPEVQEVGGLEAVRANAGVTPPTTLRARIGGFVSNNLRSIGTGIGTIGAFYAAQGLEHFAGTAEQAATGSGYGYTAARGAAGGLQGAATGALAGSIFGPWGTAIGAAVGGIYGLASASKEASAEISKLKDAQKLRNEVRDIEVAQRLGRDPATLESETINTIAQHYAQNLRSQGTNPNLAEVRGNVFESEAAKGQIASGAIPQERMQILQNALRRRAQTFGAQNPTLSEPEAGRRFFEQNRRDIQIAYGLTTNARDVQRRQDLFLPDIRESRLQRIGQRGQSEAAQIVQNFDALALSLRNATTGLDTFNRAMTVSAALAQGQIGGGANRNIATDLNQLGAPNSAPFRESVTRIGGLFGGRGNTFTQQGLALDETQRVLLSSLPTLISRLSGRVGARDPQTELKDIVRRNVGDDNLRANPFLGRALNVAVSQLGAIQPGQLSQQLATDPEGLINRLLEPLRGPLLRHGEEIGRRAQEIANSFDQAATRFNQELQRAGQAWDQAVKLSVGAIRTEAENRVQSGQGLALFNTPLATLEEGFNAPQRRLAASGGLRGAAAFDPNAIGARLSQVNAQARATYEQRETLTPGTNEYNSTNARFRELQRSSSDLQQALQHLTQVGERNAAIEERLGTLRRDEETRMSIAERFLTGGPREQLELMQQQQLVSAAAQQGNLRGFSNLDMSQIFKFLGANPNLIIGNNTGAGLRQQFLQDPFINQQLAPFLGFAGNVNTNRGQINALSGERVANAQAGAQAQGVLAEGIQGNAVQDMNEAFRATAEVSNQLELSLRAFDARVQETVAIMAQASALNLPANPQGRAAGGTIFAARGSDTVPAMLTPGEYVVNREAAQANLDLLHRMNRARGPLYLQDGGEYNPYSIGGNNPYANVPKTKKYDPYSIENDNQYINAPRVPPKKRGPYVAPTRIGIDAKPDREITEGEYTGAANYTGFRNRREVPIGEYRGGRTPRVTVNEGTTYDPAAIAAEGINIGPVPRVRRRTNPFAGMSIAEQRAAMMDPNSQEAIQAVANAYGQNGNLIGGAQAAIAYTQARMGLEFNRASSAAAFGAGLSRLNIGQRAPGLAEQFNYTATARQRLGNLGLQNSAFGITADAALGARGTYGRLQVAGSYGTPDVPTTTQQDWIVNRRGLGVVVGKYTGPDALRGHPDWRVRRFAGGGYVTGGGVTDSIPSLLTAGEFVLNANATRNIGPSTLQHFNDGGQVNTPERVTASPNVGASFTEDVGRLQSVFNSFASSIANLGNIISKIPPSIQLTANHNVNMNINGAEAFAGMEEKFTELVVRHAEAAINNLIEKRFPDAGKLDASERTPLAQEV